MGARGEVHFVLLLLLWGLALVDLAGSARPLSSFRDQTGLGCAAPVAILKQKIGSKIWAEQRVEVAEVVHPNMRRQLQQAPTYCVAAANADATALQKALDWACGQGGADCSPLQQGGACYSPNTIQAHASYAFDYYYVKQNGAANSCDFGGMATVTTSNPSMGSCQYPSVGNATNTTPASPATGTPPSSGLTPVVNTNSTSFGPSSLVPSSSTEVGTPPSLAPLSPLARRLWRTSIVCALAVSVFAL